LHCNKMRYLCVQNKQFNGMWSLDGPHIPFFIKETFLIG